MKKNILFALVFLPVMANATNGYFTHGTGLINRSLGGAGVALPQDAMTAATNPAGMAFVGNRFDLGAVLFRPDRGYSSGASLANGNGGAFTIGPNSEDSGDATFLIPSLGINYMLTERDAIGFSIYGNGGLNTSFDGGTASFDPDGPGPAGVMTLPGTFGAGTAGVDLAQVFFNFSYAHQFSEKLSVGISPIFTIQSIRTNGLDAFAGFTKTFAESGGTAMPTNLTSNGQEYSYGGGIQLGVFAKDVIGSADIGISYRSKIWMDEFDDYSDLLAEDGDFDVPPTLWAGFAVEVTDKVTLVADYQRIWYEEVDSISNDVQNLFACPTAGAGGTDVESCLGGNNGGGFGWDNINIFKLGLQWQTHPDVTMRFGYSHADNPIDSDQALFNVLAPGVVEDHITIGATIKTNGMGEINLEAMHALHNSVKGQNPFDPTQEVRINMSQFEFGLGWSKEF
jgi:long-chain fatty acid transport protein